MANATVIIKFTPTPLAAGMVFSSLSVVLTDSAGAVQTVSITASTAPTTGADGTPQYTATFTNAADGAATVVVTALASDGSTLGTALTGNGTLVSSFPQPTVITVS
jgi:hypothetical protein